VLRVDGHDLTRSTWEKRRSVLDELQVAGPNAAVADVFDDGPILFAAVCEHGLEGIVAKRRNGLYHSRRRTWVKVKNPGYWRRDEERAAMERSREHRRVAA
jgi:bifunctional non-homologous end joining protein LigD